MNFSRKQFVSALVAVFLIVGAGWGVDALAQGDAMSKQMEMMRQMMMNRPKAMKKADAQIEKVKKSATAKGKYACCLKHACSSCALKMGECPCGMNAAKDTPVCNECKGGWHAGDGAIPGKKAEDIKTMPRGM